MATKKAPSAADKKKAAAEAKKNKVKTVRSADELFDQFDNILKEQSLRHVDMREAYGDDRMSTGILVLDLLLGGGTRASRVTQVYGKAHSAKSTTVYNLTANVLAPKYTLTKRGKPVAGVPTVFFDFEGTTDKNYILNLGVPVNEASRNWKYIKAKGVSTLNGSHFYRTLKHMAQRLPDCDGGPPQMLFVLDSIAAMTTPEEMEIGEEDDDGRLARRAEMHSRWWPRIKNLLSQKNISIFATNQIRANPSPYAPPESRPGGNGWEFNTDNLIKTKAGKDVILKGETYRPITFLTEKNKNAPSGFEATVHLKLGQGFDPASDVVTFLKLCGLLETHTVNKRKVHTISPEFSQMAEMEGLSGDYYPAAFEDEVQNNPEMKESFYTAAQRLLSTGTAFELMKATRIAEASKAKAKEDAKESEDGEEAPVAKSSSAKKTTKKVATKKASTKAGRLPKPEPEVQEEDETETEESEELSLNEFDPEALDDDDEDQQDAA